MEIALVQGERALPSPGLKGACPSCGAAIVAKCGEKVIHHWAHAGRRTEIAEDRKRSPNSNMHRVYFCIDDRAKFEAADVGYRNFCWIRPHTTWLNATKPVYIDFGTDVLVRLDVYPVEMLRCVRLISKSRLIHDLGTQPLHRRSVHRQSRIRWRCTAGKPR